MNLARASSLRHDESVWVAIIALAIVHYAQTMTNFVGYHEGRFQIRGLVYGTAIVTLAHAAHPGQAQDASVVFAGQRLVQIKTTLSIKSGNSDIL